MAEEMSDIDDQIDPEHAQEGLRKLDRRIMLVAQVVALESINPFEQNGSLDFNVDESKWRGGTRGLQAIINFRKRLIPFAGNGYVDHWDQMKPNLNKDYTHLLPKLRETMEELDMPRDMLVCASGWILKALEPQLDDLYASERAKRDAYNARVASRRGSSAKRGGRRR